MKTRAFRPDVDVADWTGGQRPYDILKEGTIALAFVLVVVLALSFLFGSPDDKPVTLKQWSNAAPIDFASTAYQELAGTSPVAQYGAPYNHVPGTGQFIGPVSLGNLLGVTIPINTAADFVLRPLATQTSVPALDSALGSWNHASATQQQTWLANYGRHLPTAIRGSVMVLTPNNAGPVPTLIGGLTTMAQSGALDNALLSNSTSYYSTNYTEPLLFLSDGTYFAGLASDKHLAGDQWGMMNETGSFPGQAWLWLYTFLYQVPPYSSSANADALVWGTMMLLSVLVVFVPFIPGLRSLPRRVKLYRLIWRRHYQEH